MSIGGRSAPASLFRSRAIEPENRPLTSAAPMVQPVPLFTQPSVGTDPSAAGTRSKFGPAPAVRLCRTAERDGAVVVHLRSGTGVGWDVQPIGRACAGSATCALRAEVRETPTE